MQLCTYKPIKRMNISSQHKNTYVYIKSSNFTAGYMARRTDSRVLKSPLDTHVNSSIVYNSWKVEALQVFIDWWMDFKV